ncbi:hypothetical protein [Natrinema halophilum]|uniref:Uncharacterized protein n=1 Tax=Natrinema halophilum TaxID=1699371 RepID=A0A7D5KD40_9EURY|nr:hypothetical protein [Natrinema halophilum]QLG49096.1 hypothetical protein HYG82_09655 [Natrinema halophilum]
MTLVDGIANSEEFRETLGAIGTVFKGDGGGLFAVVPSGLFDDGQLPDVNFDDVTVEGSNGSKVAVPHYRPRCLRGGVHILAREHIAAAWYDMSPEALEWEYTHRIQTNQPIPPLLADSVDDGKEGEKA